MRPSYLLLHLAATTISTASLTKRDYTNNDYYAVHLPSHASIEQVASRLGLAIHSPLGELQDHWILEGPKQHQDIIRDAVVESKRRKRRRGVGSEEQHLHDNLLLNQKLVGRNNSKGSHEQKLFKRYPVDLLPPGFYTRESAQSDIPPPVLDSTVQHGKDIATSLGINDPIFDEQWHLYNSAQVGHDLNVTGVWMEGITGKGSITCIVDDGLDLDSEDLRDNYYADGSWDFNDPGPDPKPRLDDDRHGTRCAGEIAAVKNGVCGVGVAYDSKVAGVRILSGAISDADEAIALNYAYQQTQIYSCSWGPPDDGRSMEAPGILIRRAMLTGIQKGRGGLGSIFVFALGNGAAFDDNCNFDGYTNSIYSVSVGAIDRKGLHPYYSEACSAQLVVTYSSGSGDAIHTTDVGANECYTQHGGTSAAGPLVAGVYALVLEVRPDLNWRDFQYLTALTAAPVEAINTESDWQETALGRKFSHQYGFGKMDAWAIVQAAKNWTSVKPQAWYYSPWLHVKHDIPQGDEGLSSSFDVTADMLKQANLERLEHVTITMNVEHTRRGDLSAELISPFGVTSHIATPRRRDDAPVGYVDWTFMSVAHWNETGVGKWTVVIKDTNVNEHTGRFVDWRLRLWGECIDPALAELKPLPTDQDDDDHDAVTTSAAVGTTTHGDTHPTGMPEGNPDNHQDRPVNAKPTTTTSVPVSLPTETDAPAVPGAEVPNKDEDKDKESNFLPSPFPTFGVSKGTQVWVYGALALIAIFCTSLGAWYVMARRRRQSQDKARDGYEFTALGPNNGHASASFSDEQNGNAKEGRRGRAGELYDATAEGSESDDAFSVGGSDGEDEEEPFRDEPEGRESQDERGGDKGKGHA